MIMEPGAEATIGAFTNNGALKLESDATGTASLLIGGIYSGSGTKEIQLYLEGNSSQTIWHYISPPVVSLAAADFGSANSTVARYEENLISNNKNNGWVTYNGYHYNSTTSSWELIPALAWTDMVAGSGYDYYSEENKTFTLDGTINVSDVHVDLVYNSGGFSTPFPDEQGYNLIGNPFTCGLDWDGVVSANSTLFNDVDVESAIYFRVNGATIFYNNGFTVPDTYNADGGLIPPMQGFFIKTNADATLNISSQAKAHTVNKRYKGTSSAPHVRLQYENAVNSDQTVVYLDDKATLAFDNLLDGRKSFTSDTDPYIYSVIDGTKYSINGIPFPENSITIPLVVNAASDGSYTIKATELTGLENYNVYLNDITQNTAVNLSDVSSYAFSLTTGITADRFTLTIATITTAVPENTSSVKPFNIFSSDGMIKIQTLSDDWNGKKGEIKVLDLSGRTVSHIGNVEYSKGDIKQLPANGANGIYIVEITSGIMRYVGKVMIR